MVASAGDDKKISLWRKNGQSLGTIPMAGSDSGDNIEVNLLLFNQFLLGLRFVNLEKTFLV